MTFRRLLLTGATLALALLSLSPAGAGASRGQRPAVGTEAEQGTPADDALELRWLRFFGGADHDEAWSVATGPDGSVYTTGYTLSRRLDTAGIGALADVFLVKHSPSGDLLWTRIIGGQGKDFATDVAVAADGSVYIVGRTASPAFGGRRNAGGSEAFIMKFTAEGELLWTRLLGGRGADAFLAAAAGADGSVYVTGWTSSLRLADQTRSERETEFLLARYDAAGRRIWLRIGGSRVGPGAGIAIAPDGQSIYVAGSGRNAVSAVVASYMPTGQLRWLWQAERLQSNGATGVAVSPDGSIYLSGFWIRGGPATPSHDSDIFLSRLTSTGKFVWRRFLGGPGRDGSIGRWGGGSVAVAADGSSVYVTGSVDRSESKRGLDDFIVLGQFSFDGERVVRRFIGGRFTDIAAGVAASRDGSVYVTAVYSSLGADRGGTMLLAKYQ